MRPKTNIIKKTIGGMLIMLTSFLLLVGISYTGNNLSLNSGKWAQTSLLGNQQANTAPIDQTVTGKFSLEDLPDLSEQKNIDGRLVWVDYRVLSAPELKNKRNKPILYVEIIHDNQLFWQLVDDLKYDFKRGLVYFPYQIDDNNSTTFLYNYTGRYRLLF